jgi:choline dehydrogenase-like flavoprotein
VARWLSQGFEDLLYHLGPRQSAPADTYDFDVVIVGSGYGGAIAAEQLAGRIDKETGEEVRLCVLERGREYLSGMFPVSEAQLPGHLRITAANGPKIRGIVDGLFDMRVGPDVCALLANGLGGGSLINAGVMLRPSREVLSSDAWPGKLRGADVLSNYYDEAEKLLTSVQESRFNHFGERPVETVPLKFRALSGLGGKPVPLSIAIEGGKNAAGIELEKCIRCGDCATGCNHHAKNSLDQNCLVMARRKGAQIFCGATVLKLERLEEPRPERPLGMPWQGWKLHVVHTDPDLRRRGRPCELAARRVILAAGTFGSTEILLRSRSPTLRFSRCLGQRFSTNGDLLAVAYNQDKRVNAVALETDAFCQREIGPTITGMIDQREAEGVAIQEFAIPGALRRLFVESFAIAHTFYRLAQPGDRHFHRSGKPDPCGVSKEAIDKTQVFGLMGDDGAAGTLQLVPGCTDDCTDGAIRVHWSSLRDALGTTVFDVEARLLKRLVENSGQGGEVLPNPVWRLLPSGLESIVDIPRGPALTVHPLGGCSMADSIRYGVVDDCGRVFNPDKAAEDGHYDDLVVLDGSVIPRALGINPALTIAAVTLRAVGELRKAWMGPAEPVARADPRRMPPLRDMKAPDCVPTEISILERMTGKVWLKLKNSEPEERVVELTMTFRRHRLDQLNASLTRRLDVDGSSRIRIFEPKCYQELWDTGASEARFDECAKFIAPLAGQMRLLDREASTVSDARCARR